MSRHDLISFSKRFDITVGWDAPMRTYFAQVEDLELVKRGEDDTVVGWVGTSYSEILRPEDLRHYIEPYGILDDETLAELRDDRAATLDTRATTFQEAMRLLLKSGWYSDEEE
jgi:hypothetical protein